MLRLFCHSEWSREATQRRICRGGSLIKLSIANARQILRLKPQNDKGGILLAAMLVATLASCTYTQPSSQDSGLAAEQSGDLPRAEQLLLDTAKTAESKHDKATAQHAYYALARVCREAGQPDKAIAYYTQFLDIKKSEPPDTYHGMAWNLSELGDIYSESKQWSLAIPTYKEALDKLYDYARIPDTIHTLDKLAVCYWNQNDESTAKLTFEQAKTNYEKSIAMLSLKPRRPFLDVAYALMLDDWASLSQSVEIRQQADLVWSSLKKQVHLVSAATNADTTESIAKQYCQAGKLIEAMFLYDWLGMKTDVPHIWHLRNQCLKENKKHYCLGDAEARDNPYLKEFTKLSSAQECFDNRQILCQKYAWSVPSREAVSLLLSYQPIIEIGAGTGYWASLVKKSGGDIVAYDVEPIPSKGNSWHMRAGNEFTNVQLGDETAVRQYPQRTLFISWPPEINRCAYNTLKLFKGKHFIYIGEAAGGCTGTKEFHDLLAKDWRLTKRMDIPQWPGVYDQLYVFERKAVIPEAELTVESKDHCQKIVAKAIGEKLALVASQSPTVLGDICSLLRQGMKIQFVAGRNRAYFDQKTKTINVASSLSDSHKVLAVSHEYAHAVLNPTSNPIPGKTGRKEFILAGYQQEADAVIHELIAAQELQSAGVPLDKETSELLKAYQKEGRDTVLRYIDASKNSATEENYMEHFSRWYDETVPRSSARP